MNKEEYAVPEKGTFKRVSKKTAERLFREEKVPVWIVPSNMAFSFESKWITPHELVPTYIGDVRFDLFCNQYKFHNCTCAETGYTLRYFIRVEDVPISFRDLSIGDYFRFGETGNLTYEKYSPRKYRQEKVIKGDYFYYTVGSVNVSVIRSAFAGKTRNDDKGTL